MDPKEIDVKKRNWVESAQVKDYWRAFVKAALNIWRNTIIYIIVYIDGRH